MPLATLIPLIAQVGVPLATELFKMFEANPAATITSAQFLALHAKYGSMDAAAYLAAAGGAPATP